jgi:predicted TIM-barrel fold metal-dependent hydrolase
VTNDLDAQAVLPQTLPRSPLPSLPLILPPSLPSIPAVPVPVGTCDTHIHVFDPDRYPYAQTRSYTPPPATQAQWRQVMARLGVGRVVVVQPSCYGTDNAAMLDALGRLGPDHARGIAVLEDATFRDGAHELDGLDGAGVRGVRLNGSVNDLGDRHAIGLRLKRVQSATAHLGWHVQMYMPASTVMTMADDIAALDMPVVLDHFGGLDASSSGSISKQVDVLLDLLRTGQVYIKLSAPYRAVGTSAEGLDAAHDVLGDVVRRFAQAAPDRLLWGSDWPHTGGAGSRRATGAYAVRDVEPFRSENAASALDDLQAWLDAPEVRHRVLVCNPARLYGFAEVASSLPLIEV